MSFKSIITNQGLTDKIAEGKRNGWRRVCNDCGHVQHGLKYQTIRSLGNVSAVLADGSAKTSILFRKRAKAGAEKAHAKLECVACGSENWVEEPDA